MVRRADPAVTPSRRGRLPAPPGWLRRGPFAPDAFPSRLRSERLSAWLGLWLGLAFGICLVTGLISHGIQHGYYWPTRPVNLYRVTQGLHVATGLAAVPLLLAKLWAVLPALFTWPPAKDLAHLLSRLALLVLVASATFELASGVLNVARWYAPFGFVFPPAHYWTAWIATGALLIHIGAQLTVVRRALRPAPQPERSDEPGLSRRGLLITVGLSAGVITVATVGQTVAPLAPISLLAPRRPSLGSQRLPVNRSARAAGVSARAVDAGYRLTIAGPHRRDLSIAELTSRPQHTAELPVACVEGWSASARWTGVRLRDLLAEADVDPDSDVRVESLERRGAYRASVLPAAFARDPLTLLALRLNGATLNVDHGYPCRLIAPNRPGVLQTKWVAAIVPVRPEP